MPTLAELTVGTYARVQSIAACAPGYRHQLQAMGVTRGARLRLIRVAPLGDPLEIEVRGVRMSLRKAEASAITLEPLKQVESE